MTQPHAFSKICKSGKSNTSRDLIANNARPKTRVMIRCKTAVSDQITYSQPGLLDDQSGPVSMGEER